MCTKVRREGVLLAHSLEEFGDILDIILRCPTRPHGGSAVLTESGAFKALTLDLCEDIGLPLPPLTDASAPALRAALPEFVPVSNPVDLTAQGLVDPDLYRRALAALVDDRRFGCVILTIIQTDAKTSAIKFPPIIQAMRSLSRNMPVIFAGLDDGSVVPTEYVAQLRELKVPYFPSPSRAFRAVARICAMPKRTIDDSVIDDKMPSLNLPSGMIPEYRAKDLLKAWDIPFPDGRLARTLGEAQHAARELGYPVALKAQATDLPHKSDAGGVILNISDPDAMTIAWTRLHDTLARTRPGLHLDGVLVERMGKKGVELIIGGRNDPEWGAVILAGFGGVQAEILKDVRLLAPDLSKEEIIQELNQLKSAELLHGFRGTPALDIAGVASIIEKVGALLMAQPRIREIDLNPVIVYPVGLGAMALDALMVVSA